MTPREALDTLYRLKSCSARANNRFPTRPHEATIRAMLSPALLPKAADVAPGAIFDALAALAHRRQGSARRRARRVPPPSRPHPEPRAARLRAGPDQRPAAARMLGKLVDGLISRAARPRTVEQLGEPQSLAVAATGGYGRGMLAPFSDVDLLFLTAEAPSAHTLRVVEYMLYFLWDLGLKVGHATRSIDQCLTEAAKDTTIRTALLDAPSYRRRGRAVRRLPRQLPRRLQGSRGRRLHRRQAGRTRGAPSPLRRQPFVVEPNVKEGRGGLRDLQTLYWIARYVFGTETMGAARRGRRRALDPAKRGTAAGRGNSSGPCASTCTTSPAAPRNG